MTRIRIGLWLSGFLGVLYTLIGLFQSFSDVGAGLAVAATSVLVWGLLDWIEERE